MFSNFIETWLKGFSVTWDLGILTSALIEVFGCSGQSLSAEKDGLDIVQHEWALPKFEQRAEAVLRKLVT